MKSAVELWEDMELQGGDMGFGSFYLLTRAVEIWAEAKEVVDDATEEFRKEEFWAEADDATEEIWEDAATEKRTVEIWADAADTTEQVRLEEDGRGDLCGAAWWLQSRRFEEIWEDADDTYDQGGAEEAVAAVLLDTNLQMVVDFAPNLKGIFEITTRESVSMTDDFPRKGERSMLFSEFLFGNTIVSIDGEKEARERVLADFRSSKWREKDVDGVPTVKDPWKGDGMIVFSKFQGGNTSSSLFGRVTVKGDGGAATGGGGMDRELPVSDWWWWCNGFDEVWRRRKTKTDFYSPFSIPVAD